MRVLQRLAVCLLAACLLQCKVVVLLVKGDTVDVNVAGTQRMGPQAWAAAADIFARELAGVQFLQQQQVRHERCCLFSDPQHKVLLS
jgi:hypothetical protein